MERVPAPEGKIQADLLTDPKAEGIHRAAIWPNADFIVGNPPFFGGKLLRIGLGDEVVDQLFSLYDGRVAREADLVCYWFEQALAAVRAGRARRVGLVATNSIRSGSNRKVLDQISTENRIFEAWSDEPWVVDGAAVRVSLVCFGTGEDTCQLDGEPVARINSDLTAGAVDLTQARRLRENLGVAFMGDTKGGAFDIPGEIAREWLQRPLNPNGRPNADVLRPWRNGMDVTRRCRDMWIIDFGWEMSERDASLYEAPFQHLLEHVLPERAKNRRDAYRERWWRHVEPRPGMWRAIGELGRIIVTPEVSRHRVFAWQSTEIIPDHKLQIISRDDDFSFGILISKYHLLWSLGVGSWHGAGNDPRYTISSCFETFPFPSGLTPEVPIVRLQRDERAVAVAEAARHLDALRNAWLNPSDLVSIEPEVFPGFPDRIVPRNAVAAATLRERTLTNLYNRRPQWLIDAHRELDAAVASAYGWPADISDDDALARLLELNLARASADDARRSGRTNRRHSKPVAERDQTHMKLPITGKAGRKEDVLVPQSDQQAEVEEGAPKHRRGRRRAS